MRGALSTGGLTLAQTAVTHFGSQGALVVNPSEDYDYEYVLDWCVQKPRRQRAPVSINSMSSRAACADVQVFVCVCMVSY